MQDVDTGSTVVTMRLKGCEVFALGQLVDLEGGNRNQVLREAIAARMRQVMTGHEKYPLHPAWAEAGDERWVMVSPGSSKPARGGHFKTGQSCTCSYSSFAVLRASAFSPGLGLGGNALGSGPR